jgi:hypothetical protein
MLNWQKHISSLLLCFIASMSYGQGLLMDYTYQNAPQVGILLNNVTGFSRRAEVIRDSLHSRCVRIAINVDGWSGSSGTFDLYTDSGLVPHVELNVDSSGTNPTVWISNLSGAADTLNSILNKYPTIRRIVLDNEEMNNNYHAGTILGYTQLANALSPVCRQHNVQLANGGFGNTFGISCYTFRYLKATYGQDTADAFGDRVFSSTGQYNAANTPNSNPVLEALFLNVDSVVKCLGFDIINIHNYEPEPPNVVDPNSQNTISTNVWRFYAEAFANGYPAKYRKVMSNEFGQRYNYEPGLMTGMLQEAFKLGWLFIDRWSGTGAGLGATAVTEDDGTLNDVGDAFRDWNDLIFGLGAP